MNTQYFFFDGVDSRDYGIYLSSAIKIGGAKPNVEKISVPGRNGSLLFCEGGFADVSFSLECFVVGDDAQGNVAAISQWLLGTEGYRELRFPWEDGCRKAYVVSGPETEALASGVRAFSLEFECAPQVYIDAGQETFELTNGEILHNEWMAARPLIEVYGSGDGTIRVGGTAVTITELRPTPGIYLDCETQNAYAYGLNATVANQNSRIQALEFPTLPHGDTKISWTSNITKVRITPRWWHL